MFANEAELEEYLTTPRPELVEDLRCDEGDVLILGAGGKMGPTLCRLARCALNAAGRTADRVLAVSRWSDAAQAERVRASGVDVISFDLLANENLAELPEASAVVFMVGAKFGTAQNPALTWVVNVALPARVAARYRAARIVALSTGNVYPFVPLTSGGCAESGPVGPVGEYAMSCLGRERVLQHAAETQRTPIALLRLNYAVDLRYGVLADIGEAVLAGRPIDLSTAAVNVVWQGYANEIVLRSLRHACAEPFIVNLTGPEFVSVRRIAEAFADRMGAAAEFRGVPGDAALLSDATRCHKLFGYPSQPLGTLVDWQADWLLAGLPTLGKETKFAVRNGRF
jgi:nucleoside-diphosphate-sugar epimerase